MDKHPAQQKPKQAGVMKRIVLGGKKIGLSGPKKRNP